MKRINLNENIILSLMVLLYFFTKESIIPTYVTTFLLLIISFYFFPFKLFQNNDSDSKILLFSNILISLTLAISILGLYVEQKYLFEIFSIVNIVFMVYYAIKSPKDSGLKKSIPISHFLLLFILSMAIF